uniref:Zinc-finger double-stranded RNA-binding, putative n=1 Tax=Theileria annulata TaxID=5874 RepID=A0A3B0NIK9_THEAN
MYKRAYLYCSNAPIPINLEEDPETNKEESSINEQKNDVENENKNIDESIKNYPGNKVSYCVHCKGKTFLNQESVDKHLASKNHLKNVKKTKKNDEKMEEVRRQFIKRMAEVDKRLSQY